MIPKFASSTDMIGFLRSLPDNVDYPGMLKSDFNIEVPADAQPFHREYFYKYLVQGTFLGKDGNELHEYAQTKTLKFAADFPHVIQNYIPNEHVVEAPRAYRKSGDTQDMHGVITWCSRREKYVGWIEGKIVTKGSTVEKVMNTLKDKHSVEGVTQGD